MKRRVEPLDPYWQALATYNGEVARGIVHTQELDAEMAQRQRFWNSENMLGKPDRRAGLPFRLPEPTLPDPGRDAP